MASDLLEAESVADVQLFVKDEDGGERVILTTEGILGRFSAAIEEPVVARLVHVGLACRDIGSMNGVVVLVRRGICEFVEKVRVMWRVA